MALNRKALLISTSLVGAFALSVVAAFFMLSMRPSASASHSLPRLSTHPLQLLQFATFDGLKSGAFDWKYLVLKRSESQYEVFSVMFDKEQMVMPDKNAWGVGGYCKQLTAAVPSVSLPDGLISCADKDIPEFARSEWRWTLSGKNLGQYTSDLERPGFTLDGDAIVVGKPS